MEQRILEKKGCQKLTNGEDYPFVSADGQLSTLSHTPKVMKMMSLSKNEKANSLATLSVDKASTINKNLRALSTSTS